MSNKDYQLEKIENYDDEIDLMEIVATLVKEKVTIFITFILVSAIALGVALYERNNAKKAATILSVNLPAGKIKEINFFPVNVMSELYTSENINEKYDLSLDEFIKKFELSGIIPKEVKDKREVLEKRGESFEYTPQKYYLNLRVGELEDSKRILDKYILSLNKDLKNRFESKYQIKPVDIKEFKENDIDYDMCLYSIENDTKAIMNIVSKKSKENLDYISYGFNYRDLKVSLRNLQQENIKDLKNYLEVTNITRNALTFKDIAKGRIEKLDNLLKEKEAIQKDYSRILGNIKSEKTVNVPAGAKIALEDSVKDSYYTGIVNKKIILLNEITNMKYEKKLLETKLQNLKKGTPEEIQYVEDSLNRIIEEYNKIAMTFNRLENKENVIKFGEIIKKVTPVSVTSNSKAILILAAGLVLGVFIGMGMVFVKVFFKSLKNYMSVLAVFLLVGINSYSQEVLKLSFTHKEMSNNQNPDKTPFDLKNILVNNFTRNYLKMNNVTDSEIKIEPILMADSYKIASERINNNNNNRSYSYVPSEYKVTLNLKDGEQEKILSEKIKSEFSNYYIDYFIKSNIIITGKENLNDKDFGVRLSILNNLIDSIEEDVKNREALEGKEGKINEYNSIIYDIRKIKNIAERELESYIISNHFTSDIEKEKILLSGDKIRLTRQFELINEKLKFYEDTLKSYQLDGQQAVLTESGDITIKTESSLKSKQYFEISNKILKLLEEKNEVIRKIGEVEKEKSMLREVSKEEANAINKKFTVLENEVEKLKNKLQIIEIANYRSENQGVAVSTYTEK